MIVLSHTGGLASTTAYLVADESSGEAVIFDAPNDTVGPLLDEIDRRKWTLKGLWFTHGHFDHVADHAVVTARFPGTPLLMHPLDEPKLQHPRSAMFTLPFVIPPRSVDGHLADDQALSIGSIAVKVLHTPGHSPGHVAFHFPKEATLIGGDLILMNSVGRTDLPDSDDGQLFESLRKIMRLRAATRLLPGHGHESTLAEELKLNPYVKHALGQL